jgi:predicted RNase H-like HicB family nuclease
MAMYFAELHWAKDGYGFTIEDLPGFSAFHEGEDLEEAVKVAEAVLRDWIASNVDRGIDIPPARTMKEISDGHPERGEAGYTLIALRARFPAGRALRVNLSVDERTLAAIDDKAAARNMTRSAFLVEAALAFD